MKQLTIENFKAMLDTALKNIKEREDEFSKLDAVIGDGDHGQAIVTAMSAIVATAKKGTEFKAMLNDMGFDVMLQVSGSTSTLLGAFFLGMSDHASGTELDAAGVKAMFAGGLANVQTDESPERRQDHDGRPDSCRRSDPGLSFGRHQGDPRSRCESRPCRCSFDRGDESQLRSCPQLRRTLHRLCRQRCHLLELHVRIVRASTVKIYDL